jgi:hypothetical protein
MISIDRWLVHDSCAKQSNQWLWITDGSFRERNGDKENSVEDDKLREELNLIFERLSIRSESSNDSKENRI